MRLRENERVSSRRTLTSEANVRSAKGKRGITTKEEMPPSALRIIRDDQSSWTRSGFYKKYERRERKRELAVRAGQFQEQEEIRVLGREGEDRQKERDALERARLKSTLVHVPSWHPHTSGALSLASPSSSLFIELLLLV